MGVWGWGGGGRVGRSHHITGGVWWVVGGGVQWMYGVYGWWEVVISCSGFGKYGARAAQILIKKSRKNSES